MGFCRLADFVWAQSRVGQRGPGLNPSLLLEGSSARGALVYLLQGYREVRDPYQSRWGAVATPASTTVEAFIKHPKQLLFTWKLRASEHSSNASPRQDHRYTHLEGRTHRRLSSCDPMRI